jgi:DNA invertase Pin-like site-specific DNA recombinase
VVYTLDRLTRDIDDLFLLRREFKSLGFKSWSVYDRVEVTSANPDDLLQIVIKGYTSHRERLDIARRLRDGIESTVKAGKWGGGRTHTSRACTAV